MLNHHLMLPSTGNAPFLLNSLEVSISPYSCWNPSFLSINERKYIPLYGNLQIVSLELLLLQASEEFGLTVRIPFFNVTLFWDAERMESPTHRHQRLRSESQANIFKVFVDLAVSSPRHFWDPKLKRRCWETHVHKLSSVSSQTPNIRRWLWTWMHLLVCSCRMVKRLLSAWRKEHILVIFLF